MKYSTSILTKKAVIEDYIPLLIKTEQKLGNTNYMFFRQDTKKGLLEIGFDASTHLVHKICLLMCKDYRVLETGYLIPDDHVVGDLIIEAPNDIITSTFFCEIYSNAIKILISSETSTERIVSDNLVWELNDNGSITSLTVYGLSHNYIKHAIDELSS